MRIVYDDFLTFKLVGAASEVLGKVISSNSLYIVEFIISRGDEYFIVFKFFANLHMFVTCVTFCTRKDKIIKIKI